jgi:hypothetical protein
MPAPDLAVLAEGGLSTGSTGSSAPVAPAPTSKRSWRRSTRTATAMRAAWVARPFILAP